jgi:hypothetical protein
MTNQTYEYDESVCCELCGQELRRIKQLIKLDDMGHFPSDWEATKEQHGDLANCIKYLRKELDSVRSAQYPTETRGFR